MATLIVHLHPAYLILNDGWRHMLDSDPSKPVFDFFLASGFDLEPVAWDGDPLSLRGPGLVRASTELPYPLPKLASFCHARDLLPFYQHGIVSPQGVLVLKQHPSGDEVEQMRQRLFHVPEEFVKSPGTSPASLMHDFVRTLRQRTDSAIAESRQLQPA